MTNVGLDYHTINSYVSVLDSESDEIFHGNLDSRCELAGFLESLDSPKVLFEAGYGWPRLARLLEGKGVELVMCHAEENRRIATDRRKSDRRDAYNLAVYLKTGAYKPAFMPDSAIRDERQLIRGRMYMVRKITRIKNQVHSLLAYAGLPKENMNIFAMKNRHYFLSVKVPEMTRKILDANLEALDTHEKLLKEIDSTVRELNCRDPLARLLKTIPGVGDVTARVLLAEIGDVSRFKTDKSLACYAGLTPKQRQSGNSMRVMGLTKEGSSNIRHVLVQAAWVAVRRDPRLKQIFEDLKERKNANVAICAIARRLIKIAWHVLTKKDPYRAQKPLEMCDPAVARGKTDRDLNSQTNG